MFAHSIFTYAQNNTFFLGHSLINFHTPNMVQKLANNASLNFKYRANIGNGAPLIWHFTNPTTSQGSSWDTTLNKPGYTNFVLTEAIPLKGNMQWNNTHYYIDTLFKFARKSNPNLKLYIYETWHCIYSGTRNGCNVWEPWNNRFAAVDDNDTLIAFNTRLAQDLVKWESMADSVNKNFGANTAFVIPAGQAIKVLSDSIAAGKVPGITNISELYTDYIHNSYRGAYFIACVMYSSLSKQSPEGLSNSLTDEWGINYSTYTSQPNPIPTPAQAAVFQRIAWQVVCNYAKGGINGNCGINQSHVGDINKPSFSVYPNPNNNNQFIINANNETKYSICNIEGKELLFGNISQGENVIRHQLLSGIYFVRINQKTQKIIIE